MGPESELDTAGDEPWDEQVVPCNTGGKVQPPDHTYSIAPSPGWESSTAPAQHRGYVCLSLVG